VCPAIAGTEITTPTRMNLSAPTSCPYLRYFLFGTELPDEVITEFEAGVCDPGWMSSSDLVPIGKLARDLFR
jgi:hypothetical protein